jgi:hypothetical protein
MGVQIITHILQLVAEFVVAFRALNADPMKEIFRLTVGKGMDRHVVRRIFLETWNRVNRATYERLEKEEVIAYAIGGDGWTDKGRRRFLVSVARFVTRNYRVEKAFIALRWIREPRENAETLTRVLIEVLERLPQSDRTAQIMTDGAYVMQAMKRGVKEYLDGRKALVSGHFDGLLAGTACATCPSHALHNSLGVFWHEVPPVGREDVGENWDRKHGFLAEMSEVRSTMGDNGVILNWLETQGYDKVHFRVACLTRWQGVYTSLSDLVRLIPAYERFLSLRFDPRDECRDVAQRAFQRLAASDIDLSVMRGPVSALQEWFDGNVGEFMDFLQNDKPSLLFQFWLQEVNFLHCLKTQPTPPFLTGAATLLHDDYLRRVEADPCMRTLSLRAIAMCPFQTYADALRRAQSDLVRARQDMATNPAPAEVIDALPDELLKIGRAAAEACMVQRRMQRRVAPSATQADPAQVIPTSRSGFDAYHIGYSRQRHQRPRIPLEDLPRRTIRISSSRGKQLAGN